VVISAAQKGENWMVVCQDCMGDAEGLKISYCQDFQQCEQVNESKQYHRAEECFLKAF
jgi:hypothetical protein